MPTIAELLSEARARLAGADAAGDAELLLRHALGWSRGRLIADAHEPAPDAAAATFAGLVAARARGVPVAYLFGRREFWSLDLEVSDAVLVPRPDTELLVERALEALRGRAAPRIADLGTGSGAVGLAIASERPDAEVVLVDVSEAAAAVARRNAAALGLERVCVRIGDWVAPLAEPGGYDLIVSNPPYLASDDPHLEGPGLAHEPRLALVSGPTGLEALSAIAAGAPRFLKGGAPLLLEHGAEQGAAVRALLQASGLAGVETHRDLAGRERVTGGRATG